MSLIGKVKGLGNNFHTFTVLGSKIIIQQLLKRLLNHFFLIIYLLIIHN